MRKSLQITLAFVTAASALLHAAAAHAQAYPSRPVRIVVPATTGDGSDVLARTIAKSLTESMGQSFVIDNKPGAGGSLAADAVAKAAPDGYTIFLANGSTHGSTPSLYPNLPYDSVRDFAPITMISSAANVLVVGAGVRASNVAEFIALAKKQPGKMTLASAGNGSISHLSAELLESMAGIDVLHVPYKGASPALVDIASGQVDGMVINIPTVLPLLQGGKLKILGVTSLEPAASLRVLGLRQEPYRQVRQGHQGRQRQAGVTTRVSPHGFPGPGVLERSGPARLGSYPDGHPNSLS